MNTVDLLLMQGSIMVLWKQRIQVKKFSKDPFSDRDSIKTHDASSRDLDPVTNQAKNYIVVIYRKVCTILPNIVSDFYCQKTILRA